MGACGFVAWHTGGGHLSFTPFLFFPLILLVTAVVFTLLVKPLRRLMGDVQ